MESVKKELKSDEWHTLDDTRVQWSPALNVEGIHRMKPVFAHHTPNQRFLYLRVARQQVEHPRKLSARATRIEQGDHGGMNLRTERLRIISFLVTDHAGSCVPTSDDKVGHDISARARWVFWYLTSLNGDDIDRSGKRPSRMLHAVT